MEYAAYDRVGGDAREGGSPPWSGSGRAGSMSDAQTMPCVASSEDPFGAGPPSLPWCVDRGASLEAMSTTALWRALELGILPPETRVWREGMECWTPARQVRELRWTVTRFAAADAAAAAAQDRGEGLVSAGLTPAEMGTVKQWAASSAPPPPLPPPGSSQEQRAELPTLMSTPEPSSQGRLQLISLDLPASFPEAPAFSRSASPVPPPAAAPAPAPAPAPLARDVDQAASAATEPPRPANPARDRGARLMALRQLAQQMARGRDRLFVGAGAAIALLAIGAALVEPALSPARASAGRAAELPLESEAAPAAAFTEEPGQAGAAAGRTTFSAAAGRTSTSAAQPEGVAARGQAAARWGERGQYRQRRGHAERPRGGRADASGAERAESR